MTPSIRSLLDEPAGGRLFLCSAGVAGAARGGAGVEDDGGAARVVETGVDDAGPSPSRPIAAGKAGPCGEAVELVVVVVGFGEPVLVPHGIGDDAVEGLQAFALVGISGS